MVPVNGLNNKFIYLSNMDPGTHWKLWNIKQEKKLGNQWSDDSLTSFPISLENILLSVNPSEPEGMLLSISLNLNNKTFIKNHRPPPHYHLQLIKFSLQNFITLALVPPSLHVPSKSPEIVPSSATLPCTS